MGYTIRKKWITLLAVYKVRINSNWFYSVFKKNLNIPLLVLIRLDEFVTEFRLWLDGGVDWFLVLAVSVSLFVILMLLWEEELADCCFKLPRKFLNMDLNAGEEFVHPAEDGFAWLLGCLVGVVVFVELETQWKEADEVSWLCCCCCRVSNCCWIWRLAGGWFIMEAFGTELVKLVDWLFFLSFCFFFCLLEEWVNY